MGDQSGIQEGSKKVPRNFEVKIPICHSALFPSSLFLTPIGLRGVVMVSSTWAVLFFLGI